MNGESTTSMTSPGWEGPGMRDRRRWRWSEVLWSLIFPARTQRVRPTVSGLVLIGLALGIGSAAYNAANNILFITLSLLLACLILSGVMSWFNMRGVCWRLQLAPPLRAGQEKSVTLELWNRKPLLPTYGLWFELTARPVPAGPQRPETTFRATSGEIRAALARLQQGMATTVLPLRERLDPAGRTQLDWVFTPARRGRVRVELASVGSLFPFGFLRKSHGTRLRREAMVWPAPVAYRFTRTVAAGRQAEGGRVARPGGGNDLLALRRYEAGDSHRLIHWKASARLRQLMVRQFAAESAEGFWLWLDSSPAAWPRAEQFELLCRFAATLAEDLFTAGRLTGAAIDAEEPIAIRRVRDLEAFLDQLAVLEPAAGNHAPDSLRPDGVRGAGARPGTGAPAGPHRRHLITFAPEGTQGVAAYVNGEKSVTA